MHLYHGKEMKYLAVLFIGIGGFIGSCLRYLITKFCAGFFTAFPLGTFLVNIAAAFLIGFVMGIQRQTNFFPQNIQLFLTTGLLGGLSTFSALGLETVTMFESGHYLLALFNMSINVILCLVFVFLGLTIGKVLL